MTKEKAGGMKGGRENGSKLLFLHRWEQQLYQRKRYDNVKKEQGSEIFVLQNWSEFSHTTHLSPLSWSSRRRQ
jgi:hypothetical protein